MLGVPFYSRPGYKTYAQIVATNPAIANQDCATISGVQRVLQRPADDPPQDPVGHGERRRHDELGAVPGRHRRELAGQRDLRTATGGTTPPPTGRTGRITGIAGKCVDIAAASSANGTAVQLYDCNGTAAQTWTVATDGTLRGLGKCLDVTAAGTANGSLVQIYDCNGTGAQVWQAQSDGTLRNPVSGQVPGRAATTARRTAPACRSGTASPAPTSAGPSRPDLPALVRPRRTSAGAA